MSYPYKPKTEDGESTTYSERRLVSLPGTY
jgi:hypothetical protein